MKTCCQHRQRWHHRRCARGLLHNLARAPLPTLGLLVLEADDRPLMPSQQDALVMAHTPRLLAAPTALECPLAFLGPLLWRCQWPHASRHHFFRQLKLQSLGDHRRGAAAVLTYSLPTTKSTYPAELRPSSSYAFIKDERRASPKKSYQTRQRALLVRETRCVVMWLFRWKRRYARTMQLVEDRRLGQIAVLFVDKVAARGSGCFPLQLRRLLQRHCQDDSLSYNELGLAVLELLPGINNMEIEALCHRLDLDSKGRLFVGELVSVFQAIREGHALPPLKRQTQPDDVPTQPLQDADTPLRKTTSPDAAFLRQLDVYLAKLSGRLATMTTKSHARLPAAQRLPSRKAHLLRTLGQHKLREAFEAVRSSPFVKLTPQQFRKALAIFRTPGQPMLGAAECAKLWTLCDCGDPETFVRLFREHEEESVASKGKVRKSNVSAWVAQTASLGSPCIEDRSDLRFRYRHAQEEVPAAAEALKLRYKHSRTLVSPPVGWRKRELARAVARSSRPPTVGLALEHVFGYSSDIAGPNLASGAGGIVVYTTAAIAVATHLGGGRDRPDVFFRGHTDDVACIAVDAEGVLGATGQVASADDGKGSKPFVCVWSVARGTELRRFGGDGSIQRLACAVTFFRDSSHLAVVSGDDRHTMYIFDLARSNADAVLVAPCKSGVSPPAVWAIATAPQHTCDRMGVDHVLVTLGVGHLAVWLINLPRSRDTSTAEQQQQLRCSRRLPCYGSRRAPSATHCCAFVPRDNALVTGASDGKIYVWRAFAVVTCFQAHSSGPCRAIAHASNCMYSGGADGVLKKWDMVKGKYSLLASHASQNPHRRRANSSPSTNATQAAFEKAASATVLELGGGASGTQLYRKVGAQRRSRRVPAAFENLAKTGDRGILDLILHPFDESLVICGYAFGEIAVVDVSRGHKERTLQRAHHAPTAAICAHPSEPKLCASVGLDCLLCVWHVEMNRLEDSTCLDSPGLAVAVNTKKQIAVGLASGAVSLHDLGTRGLPRGAVTTISSQPLACLKFSPNESVLAVGSHDCLLYLLDADTFATLRKFAGHSSYLTHLTFSVDSKLLQSTCGGYEILYWDVDKGIQVNSTHDSVESDTDWHDWTLTLGFPVMGVFAPDSDGTDVNCAHRSKDNSLVVTGDDSGYVNLFIAPVVCRHAAKRQYSGHSSHCVGVSFLADNERIVTTGGRDAAVLVWRIVDATTKQRLGTLSQRCQADLILPLKVRPAWNKGCEITSSTDVLRNPATFA